MALTAAERAKNYRYFDRLSKAIDKVSRLLMEMPEKYRKNPHLFQGDCVEYTLLTIMSDLYQSDFEFREIDGEWHVSWNTHSLASGDIAELRGMEVVEHQNDFLRYLEHKETQARKNPQALVPTAIKMTRNAFCEQVLEAELTNARWGWVGVKEGTNGQPGALYLFGWEHNRGRDGEGTVGLFHQEVSVDENGRRRPGHRDALEKIERVIAGELEPYIVWQTAVDPTEERKTIESINGDFVSACELYIDDKGYWTAKLGDSVSLPKVGDLSKEER